VGTSDNQLFPTTYIVDLNARKCDSKCQVFNQFQCTCCHMLAASCYAEEHHGIVYDLPDLFNEVYLTKNYISLFALITIKIPTVQMLIANDNIRSAPEYTQAGRPLKRVKDIATRKRRLASNGEHYSAPPNQSINGNLEIQGVNSSIG
jgi:hypothetical protein